ncbi:MAG: winged helix-turn-helix domain-containing protein [Microbacterium sp.]|uniref:winged helix-turn-helix domain-containing protein n=1 Tax=Microbacterium sp. TaxID=51671 RepID=UPI003F9CC379
MCANSRPNATAVEVFGASRVRVAIIRCALAHESVTAVQLMRGAGVARATLDTHIPALEAAGILTRSRAPRDEGSDGSGDRRGGQNALLWRIDPVALSSWLDQFSHELAAPLPDTASESR